MDDYFRAAQMIEQCRKTGYAIVDERASLHLGMELNGTVENADSPEEVDIRIMRGYPYKDDECYLMGVNMGLIEPIPMRDAYELMEEMDESEDYAYL